MSYREWVAPSPVWWVVSACFSLSWLVAVGFYLGPAAGLTALIVAQGLATTILLAWSVRIAVSAGEVRVGRAVLELDWVGAVVALDPAATTERTGLRADARAQLVLSPYAKSAVELTLADPIDPVPYWLVSSRRPVRLVAAIDAARRPLG